MSIEMGNTPSSVRAAVVLDHAVAVRQVEELMGARREVGDAARRLEADQVAAEQALDDLRPPRQPGEQLERRERDVQEESDRQVGALLAQHRRHELQLVVVDPHGGVRRRDVGQLHGEAFVDRDVGVPLLRRRRSTRAARRGRAATGRRSRIPRSTARPRRR